MRTSFFLKEVKMSAEMTAKVVHELLRGGSPLLTEWIEKVKTIGGMRDGLVVEGSENAAGLHPGVIFTEDTRADKSNEHHTHLNQWTQAHPVKC